MHTMCTQILLHAVQLILKALEADLRKMMSPNTATNLRVSDEGFLCAVWHAVSAFKTCTHACVYVLLNAAVLSWTSAKDGSSPL